jgi:hypothetical protein
MCPQGDLCSVHGYCFPKKGFPKLQHNVKRGEMCYFDEECASQSCTVNATNKYGRVGKCD